MRPAAEASYSRSCTSEPGEEEKKQQQGKFLIGKQVIIIIEAGGYHVPKIVLSVLLSNLILIITL